MKKCSTCKAEKPHVDFYKDKRTPDGLKSQCKKCHSVTSLLSRDVDNHREYQRNWMRSSKYATREDVRERSMLRTRVRHKGIEVKARALANRAVELGFLDRPVSCPACKTSALTIHAHHEDYSRPLDVIWLCSECHGKKHRKTSSSFKVVTGTTVPGEEFHAAIRAALPGERT